MKMSSAYKPDIQERRFLAMSLMRIMNNNGLMTLPCGVPFRQEKSSDRVPFNRDFCFPTDQKGYNPLEHVAYYAELFKLVKSRFIQIMS
jgi:hypothetical protein